MLDGTNKKTLQRPLFGLRRLIEAKALTLPSQCISAVLVLSALLFLGSVLRAHKRMCLHTTTTLVGRDKI